MQWGIDSIASVAALQAGAPAAGALPANAASGAAASDAFAKLMQSGINDLNASVGAAETAMRDLAAGKPVELHEVMISLEQARISVQTFIQVRNKLIDSYQELMRMQL
jgi:flagellar hook-basal body complex protein FliE